MCLYRCWYINPVLVGQVIRGSGLGQCLAENCGADFLFVQFCYFEQFALLFCRFVLRTWSSAHVDGQDKEKRMADFKTNKRTIQRLSKSWLSG